MMEAMSFGFDLQMYMTITEVEHVNQYHLLELASKDSICGITTVEQGRLPHEFFPDMCLKEILFEVQTMVKKRYPDYQLAADHISHYRDMKLVTFAVDQNMHALVVSFPVFMKHYRKPPLAVFEIETVPVPMPDRKPKATAIPK